MCFSGAVALRWETLVVAVVAVVYDDGVNDIC